MADSELTHVRAPEPLTVTVVRVRNLVSFQHIKVVFSIFFAVPCNFNQCMQWYNIAIKKARTYDKNGCNLHSNYIYL